MSINKAIFNLCAGMQEKGETIEECIRRELYEETGLSVKKMLKILPPSYSAVGFSDTKTYIAFVEAGIFQTIRLTMKKFPHVFTAGRK